MLFLALDVSTSLEFWRRIYPTNRAPYGPTALPDDCFASTQQEVWQLAPNWLTEGFAAQTDGLLHAFVSEAQMRRQSSNHRAHVWTGSIPHGSFYQLSPDVYIASPEFIMLVAGALIDVEPLIALGDELCGLYGFDSSEKRGFRKRTVPLLTVSRLGEYMKHVGSCPGIKRVRKALPYIVDRSASPMETFDEMAICLPYRLGGYGVQKPDMNFEVILDDKAAWIAKRNKVYLDMYWEAGNLDVEHHGKLDHSEFEDVMSDRARVNAVREQGFEVIELTGEQVGDIMCFEYIIARIAKLVGRKLDGRYMGYADNRIKLHDRLKKWNASSGQIR